MCTVASITLAFFSSYCSVTLATFHTLSRLYMLITRKSTTPVYEVLLNYRFFYPVAYWTSPLDYLISISNSTQRQTELINRAQRPARPSVFPVSVNGFIRHYTLNHCRLFYLLTWNNHRAMVTDPTKYSRATGYEKSFLCYPLFPVWDVFLPMWSFVVSVVHYLLDCRYHVLLVFNITVLSKAPWTL